MLLKKLPFAGGAVNFEIHPQQGNPRVFGQTGAAADHGFGQHDRMVVVPTQDGAVVDRWTRTSGPTIRSWNNTGARPSRSRSGSWLASYC